jgi:hypothetical protein
MKQMTDILAPVNYDLGKIKLVKCLAAHNEEDWILYNLENNYDEFDVIRVVEGAVEGRPKSTPDGHSTDRTLDLIKNFPDPANKIELYTLKRPFKALEEQKQIFLDAAHEDEWLFIVDCDEFYMDGEVNKIRRFIQNNPTAMEFVPTFLHFYRDFWHVRDFEGEWNLWHQRIFRYQPGMRYHTHPVATLVNGKCSYFTPEFQRLRWQMPGTYIYHYGHAKGQEFHAMKRDFYRSELAKFPAGDGQTAADAFDTKFKEFVEYTERLDSILEFDLEHPSVMRLHPAYKQREPFYADKRFRNFRESRAYSEMKLPTIPQWMMYDKKMQPVYNVVR